MKTLHKLRLSSLTQLEAGQLISQNLTDLDTAGINVATDAHIATYTNQMAADKAVFDLAIIQIRKQEETALLVTLDHDRDIAFAALKRQLNVFEYSQNATELEAYNSLRILLNAYKNLPILNYEAETNAIVNLLLDLASAKYALHVITLNLGHAIDRLKNAKDEFSTVFSHRSTEVASTVVYDTKTLRKTMLANYSNYVAYVLALAKAVDNDYYNGILDIVNISRKYFSDMLARRGHGNGGSNPPAPEA